MMKQMRENTKWIMLATALAFVALMVFQWGMNVTGRTSMGVGQIGSVNGQKVMYDDWQTVYRNLYDQVQQQQDRPITSEQNSQIEDQAWDQLVDQILISQQLDERGIDVTDQEIRQAARVSPPPQFRQAPIFQDSAGNFDLGRYQQYLATSADDQLLLQLEQYYRSVIPRSKLMRQVTTGIFPSDAALWQRWRDGHEKVRIDLSDLDPSTRIPDSTVSVTQEEVASYYRQHHDDFEVPAQVSIKIAALSKAPTAADTAATLQKANDLRQAIADGDRTFEQVAKEESADQVTAPQGGELGTYARGELTPPALDSAVFATSQGRLTQPIKGQRGYHVIEVEKRWADSAQIRHILVPIQRTDSSELDLLTRADSLEALTKSMSLEAAADTLGVQVRSATITPDFPVAPVAGPIDEGLDWAMNEEPSPGDVSPVYENDQAFYAIELVNLKPAGYQPLGEATPGIRQRLTLQKKQDRMVSRAGEIADGARQAGSLDSVASRYDMQIQKPDPFTRVQPIPGVGPAPEVVGTAFGLEKGQISDPVASGDQVYLVQLLEKIPADSTEWLAQLDTQRDQIIGQAQQQRLQEWIQGLREKATIVDRRDEVLQRAEDQQAQQANTPQAPSRRGL